MVTLTTENEDRLELLRSLGELDGLANPDGYMAQKSGLTADERLAEIWNVLQRIGPRES